jgi:hypothetical protein
MGDIREGLKSACKASRRGYGWNRKRGFMFQTVCIRGGFIWVPKRGLEPRLGNPHKTLNDFAAITIPMI